MPDLNFQVEQVEVVSHAVAPTLAFKLHIEDRAASVPIHSVVLRCQIRIEPARRRYDEDEQDHLLDLFGAPQRWSRTLRSLLWTHVNVIVPAFTGSTTVELPVACSSDLNVAAAKYFYALDQGHVPLEFLFSGTVFYSGSDGRVQIGQISWEKEAAFLLPVQVWREMIAIYYPNSAWLYLRKDVFDQLYQYKSHHGLPTWEQAIEGLLEAAGAQVTS